MYFPAYDVLIDSMITRLIFFWTSNKYINLNFVTGLIPVYITVWFPFESIETHHHRNVELMSFVLHCIVWFVPLITAAFSGPFTVISDAAFESADTNK